MSKRHPDYPKGVVAIYDNGGTDKPNGSVDRYTVFYTRRGMKGLDYIAFIKNGKKLWRPKYPFVAMSREPFHPQGFGQHGEGVRGIHCGHLIAFADLPEDCQKLVHQDLKGD